MNNDVYIERWEQAKHVLEKMTPHEREKHFDMSNWGFQNDCGTVACLAGHCSLEPWFQERGFTGKFLQGQDPKRSFLSFEGADPDEFFGQRGHDFVFMRTSKNYDEVLELVDEHIAYLKDGGSPHTSFDYESADEEAYRDDDEGDGDDD